MPFQELKFGGLHNSVAESRVPEGRAWAMQNAYVDNGILELGKRYALFGAPSTSTSGDVGWGLGYGKYNGNEVQLLSLTGTVTGGSITLRWRPNSSQSYQTTTAILYNASASGVQATLEALSNIAPGDIVCTGGPLPGIVRIQFQKQYANQDLDLIELVTNSLQGSGTGVRITEEIKGGTNEEYLTVVQASGSTTATLYSVHTQNGTYTQVATGLHASDWYFAQYQQRIWAVNRTDGLHFKTIGGSWDNGQTGTPPPAPGAKPQFSVISQPSYDDWTGKTFTVSGPSSSTTLFTPGGGLYIQNTGASLTTPTSCMVLIDYLTGQDWSHEDFWEAYVSDLPSNVSPVFFTNGSLKFSLLDNGGVETVPTYRYTYENTQERDDLAVQFTTQNRTGRALTRKQKLTFIVTSWPASSWIVLYDIRGHVWTNDELPLTGFESPGPGSFTRAQVEYAYSYSTSAGESDLSPSNSSPPVPTSPSGCWVQVECQGSSQLTTSDRIYVYRKRKADGTWRRLPLNASNLTTYGAANATGGLVQFVDKWMEEELESFPPYEKGGFPSPSSGIYPDQIGIWKQCMTIGANKQAWISGVGKPTVFAPSPDDPDAPPPDEDDLTRGKTEYVSDDRSEDVLGIHGQDSLYLVTPLSTYSIIGDVPAESTPPRRLPESRGTLGRRSSYRLGGGVLSGAEDGLWRYSVGRGFSGEDNGALVAREETDEARRSWAQTLLGGALSGSGVVVCEYLDEFWAFNGTKYMVKTRNRHWLEGTFTHSVKAVYGVRHLPLRFLDTTGRMHTLSQTYTTDAGTGVSWSYTTGLLDSYRARIRGIQMRGTGRPSLTVTVYDGRTPSQTMTFRPEREGQNYLWPVQLQPGFRFRFQFEGEAQDTVEFCALQLDEQTPPGAGN